MDHLIGLRLGRGGIFFQRLGGLHGQFALQHDRVKRGFRKRQRRRSRDMHRELLADHLCFGGVALQRNQHADLAHAISRSIVDIGHHGVAFQNVQTAEGHVLIDAGNGFLHDGFDGLAVQMRGFHHFDRIANRQGHIGHIADQRLEIGVLGDEVGFRVDLDRNSATVRNGHADQAFRCNAISLLGSLGQTLGPQPVDSRFHVAIDLGQGLLGIHHPCAGGIAQFLHHLGGDRHGFIS